MAELSEIAKAVRDAVVERGRLSKTEILLLFSVEPQQYEVLKKADL